MPSDASIYSQIQQPQQPNRLAELAQAMQIQGAMGQQALNQYTLRSAQRKDEETNKLAELLKTPGFDLSTPEGQQRAYGVAPTVADSYIKNQQDRLKSKADIEKTGAETGKLKQEAVNQRVLMHRDLLAQVTNPQQAAQWLTQMHSDPAFAGTPIATVPLEQKLATIPTDPQGFNTWRQQMALGAQKFIELNKPTVHMQDTGGTSNVVLTPGLGGPATVISSTRKTATPDAQMHRQTQLEVAGVAPGGGLDDNAERTAQAIASGQLPAPTGMALLNPKNQRILGRVMEINPSYDATTVDAKKKAARDFTSGPQGNAMRSFAVAGDHLDQLGTLVDALGNGNMQLVNELGNAYSQQTGNPAVTNFDAAKDVVSKEVVKAIVAGGGGVSEREELSKLMSSAKSPAQLKGVIQQYRNLMAAQHDALLQQRDAAGLPRSTLPNYTGGKPSAAAGVPPDIAAILDKHGNK